MRERDREKLGEVWVRGVRRWWRVGFEVVGGGVLGWIYIYIRCWDWNFGVVRWDFRRNIFCTFMLVFKSVWK